MENKEPEKKKLEEKELTKNSPAEVDEELLDNVSGGGDNDHNDKRTLKPIIL